MMQLLSSITEYWFGLCRKPPVIQAVQITLGSVPEPALQGEPGGGGGIPGRIRCGIGAALTGMKTLNENRQLLWFTLLAGLLFAGNAILQAAFWYLSYNMHAELDWIAWKFGIELATVFCLVFLLAGLVLTLSRRKEKRASFFAGLVEAKHHVKAIVFWSLVLAIAGMLLDWMFFSYPSLLWWPRELWIYNIFGNFETFLRVTLSQFPFNPMLRFDLFTEIPGYGGRSLFLWIYPGLMDTLTFSAINLVLCTLTLVFLPGILLGQSTVKRAFGESFALGKKIWVDVAACIGFLGILVGGVFLSYLLLGAAYWMFAPHEILTYQPSVPWILVAFLYDLALCIAVFVAATVGGIAVLNLGSSENT